MLGHLGINVPDLSAAKSYYGEIMPMLGFEEYFSTADEVAFKPAGGKQGTFVFFYPAEEVGLYSRHGVGLQHLAFSVAARSVVVAVHDRVLSLGGEVLHAPQNFPQYPPPYYATFWLDPFGCMLEAVCHRDRD